MTIPYFFFASNPFFEAYFHADLLGKLIFLGLLAISLVSWTLIIHKTRQARRAQDLAQDFQKNFDKQANNPLSVEYSYETHKEFSHPFHDLYKVLRRHTLEILNKNRVFAEKASVSLPEGSSYLGSSDVELIESHLASEVSSQTQGLEKNLFLLSSFVTLSPFLGLLGTVWGILTTFSELQAQAASNTNQLVLHGLSLALATTVLGLINAIPALLGYNYLKARVNNLRQEMEGFATGILSVVELHYRKVDTL